MAGSGFQLDSNQVIPSYYTVTLTMSTANYPAYSGSGSALATQGGVNPYDWTQSTVYTGGLPTNSGYAQVLAQGNIRFERILELVASYADCRVLDPQVVVAGTSGNYQPTSLSFTLVFDRDEFLLPNWSKAQQLAGATANGTYTLTYQGNTSPQTFTAYNSQNASGTVPITTPALALQDMITTAICSGGTTGWSKTYRVFSVTQNGDSQQTISIQQPATPATIYPTVAVSPVGTTGINF